MASYLSRGFECEFCNKGGNVRRFFNKHEDVIGIFHEDCFKIAIQQIPDLLELQ